MTSPRPYGGGYYAAPAFPDTPIYDSLVEERGTPQIAPIRVPSYDSGHHLPALPAPRAALPPAPVPAPAPMQHHPHTAYSAHTPAYGGHQPAPQPAPPQPFIPQQAQPRWDQGYEQPRPQQQQPRPQQQSAPPPGYEAMRPVAPRPAPPQQAQPARPASPQTYADQYARPYYQDGQRY